MSRQVLMRGGSIRNPHDDGKIPFGRSDRGDPDAPVRQLADGRAGARMGMGTVLATPVMIGMVVSARGELMRSSAGGIV